MIMKHRLSGKLPDCDRRHLADQYGRDILLRILYGSKYSLSVGIVAVMVSLRLVV